MPVPMVRSSNSVWIIELCVCFGGMAWFLLYVDECFICRLYAGNKKILKRREILADLNDSLVAAVFNVKTIFIVILIVAVVGIISYIRENKLK